MNSTGWIKVVIKNKTYCIGQTDILNKFCEYIPN